MNSTSPTKPLRLLLASAAVAAVFAVMVIAIGSLIDSTAADVVLPFGAAALSVAGLSFGLSRNDPLAQHAGPATGPRTTPDEAVAGVQAGSLQEALYDLARVLAEGTRAQHAAVWLAAAEKLVSAEGKNQPCVWLE